MLRRSALVLTAALALQAIPSLASAPDVVSPHVTTVRLGTDQVVALTGERMVGVTWATGTPTVQLRWHTRTGWGSWETAEDDTADSPEGSPGTAPQWRPAGSDLVQVRTTGSATRLQLVRVADGHVHRVLGSAAHAASGNAVLGTVHSRADWRADESIRRGRPRYARRVNAVVVHHTVNRNGYRAQDVPALIRADYAYHVQARGWGDLGYNLLVDQYGGVWEGRAGGLGRATIGAHAQGFNTGTLGVAMLGDLTKTTATPAGRYALARVFAYAAATWHFDPEGSVRLTSQGSPRYASGRRVTLHRVFGHRETGRTACPGSLQDTLPALRHLAKVVLQPAPRILSARLTGAPLHAPDPAVLDGRLSARATWSAVLTDPDGAVVAGSRGTGTRPRVSWDGRRHGDLRLPAAPGTYHWQVTAGDGFHPAVRRTGTFEVGLPFVGVTH